MEVDADDIGRGDCAYRFVSVIFWQGCIFLSSIIDGLHFSKKRIWGGRFPSPRVRLELGLTRRSQMGRSRFSQADLERPGRNYVEYMTLIALICATYLANSSCEHRYAHWRAF